MSEQVPNNPPEELSWSELLFGRNNTVWFLVVAIGFVIFELTAQRAVVAVAVCSKFGIPDFLNAFWVRRTDPLRARGKTCFWFCLSQGLWKTTCVAFVAMLMFIVLSQLLGARGGPPPGFVGTAMTFLIGFILASLTTVIGSVIARIGGLRVWIDGGLTAARREKKFPPEPGQANRIHWLLAGAMILPVVIFLIATLIVAGARPNAIGNAVGVLVGLFLLPASIFGGGLLVAKAVVARDFDECWSRQSRKRGMTLEELAEQEGILHDRVSSPEQS